MTFSQTHNLLTQAVADVGGTLHLCVYPSLTWVTHMSIHMWPVSTKPAIKISTPILNKEPMTDYLYLNPWRVFTPWRTISTK